MVGSISQDLQKLRKDEGLSQADVASRIKAHESKISRIESGAVEPTPDEVAEILDAIGSSAAKEYVQYLRQDFHYLPKPPFGHPSRAGIFKAEKYLQKLEHFAREIGDNGLLHGQAQLYKKALQEAGSFLLNLIHQLAFVGEIAVGKTTAICKMFGLILPQADRNDLIKEIVLAVGTGRTTICEVCVKQGDQYGLLIDPVPDEEVYRLVADLCAGLIDQASDKATDEPQSGQKGVSKELGRAIRNMAGIPIKSGKGSDGRRIPFDPAKGLVEQFKSLDELRSEISGRLQLWKRTTREIWWAPGVAAEPLAWLQEQFAAVNRGLLSAVGLPERITVVVPKALFSAHGLTFEIVDTRGIDDISVRPDLQRYIDDPATQIVLCSGFGGAPASSIQTFLQHAMSSGQERAVSERSAVLVLPRFNEVLGTSYDEGNLVESYEEAYELKRGQVLDALSQRGIGDLPVLFFNAGTDSPAPALAELSSRVVRVRKFQGQRIDDVALAIDEMIANRTQREAIEARNQVAQALAIFVQQHEALPSSKRPFYEYVVDTIGGAHQRTVWASTRRKGRWSNLDVYFLLGQGATIDVTNRSRRALEGLSELVRNMQGNRKLMAAQELLKELSANIPTWRDAFLGEVRSFGSELMRPRLHDDDAFWLECESIYGRGLQFRAEVAGRIRGWIENDARADLVTAYEKRVQTAWDAVVLGALKGLSQ